MADALLSPAVGGTMWAVSAGAIAYCSRKLRNEPDERKVPLMGVMGAFVFAAQMINFTIPGTGSSGHLGGGLLLAVLLGPHAAFLAIASVLSIQALFFADGGILALGCNIFNLGFFPAFVAYPLIYKRLANGKGGRLRVTLASVPAAVVGLQLGASGVVLETVLSGVSELPLMKFALVMLPIHLAIGLIEGFVTAVVIAFIARARPDILEWARGSRAPGRPVRNVALALFAAAVVTGGALSWYASENPDGLEWSISRITGEEEVGNTGPVHSTLFALQDKLAVLPDYAFRRDNHARRDAGDPPLHASHAGTTASGLAGGIMTLTLVFGIGFILRKRNMKV